MTIASRSHPSRLGSGVAAHGAAGGRGPGILGMIAPAMPTSPSLIDHYRAFARYNERFNRQLYDVVAELTDDERSRDLGAFFGSVDRTLHHILQADRIWLSRFRTAGFDFPALEEAELEYGVQGLAPASTPAFDTLRRERVALDQVILAWIEDLDDEVLGATLRYTNMAGTTREHVLWIAISHLFNHQTHHRGQVTTLLKQLGRDVGVTDFLMFALG